MMLWLDDIRTAPEGWVHVHDYKEFCKWIEVNGLPEFISFDHDLGPYDKTGYDCAKYLVNYCLNNSKPLPKYRVHSMNPVGAENILGLFSSFERAMEKMDDI